MRRTLGIVATAATISIAAILPAGAQTAPDGIDTYAAGSFARAVSVTLGSDLLGPLTDELGSNQFSLAQTSTSINDVPGAIANGAAVLTPLFSSPSLQAPNEEGEPHDDDCQTIPGLPAEVTTDLVCVKVSAEVVDGNPVATATAAEVVIEIKAPAIIGETEEINEIVEQIQAGLNGLFDGLAAVLDPVEEATQISLRDAINDLIDEVQAGHVLVRITVAPSSALSQLTSENVLASAKSNGAVIEVLPDLPGGALAVATVGASTASVTRDAITGAATPTGGASLIGVTYPNEALAGLAPLTDALATALGTVTSLLPCDPDSPTGALAGVVCFDVGKSVTLDAAQSKALGLDFGPTTVGQHSSVLDVQVLAAAPGGPVARLQVGETAAAAAATTPLPRQDPPPPDPTPLPRTGGEATLPLTMALLGLGMGGAVLVRRSRTI